MVIGAALAVVGVLVRFAPGLFSWFGHLPGAVRIESDGSRVFTPVASMMVASVALTDVVNVVAVLLRNR
jgi:hypothetical protein